MSKGPRKATLEKMLIELTDRATEVLGMTAVYWEGQDFARGKHPLDPLERAINKARKTLGKTTFVELR